MKLAFLSFVYADYPRKQNNQPFLFYQKDKKYKHAVYLIKYYASSVLFNLFTKTKHIWLILAKSPQH